MRANEFLKEAAPDWKARAKQLLAQGLTEQQVAQQLIKEGCPPRQAAVYVQGAQLEDYHPNDTPPGPETKPTMPAGTVRVDVDDVYDWYKLGQHISNMKGLGKHDFGQGPPSTIFAFGSEEEEHKYIDALKKTGLTTTDIDPVDPKQPKGMPRQKTDPTYNVDEEFAGTKVGHKAGPAGQLKAKAKVDVKGTVLGSPEKSQQGLRGKLVGGSMEEELEQLEERRRKRRKARRASYGPGAWGPGPYGGYGFDAGYSGDMGGGGDGGGMEENFADGKNPQDKGDSKRHGINTKASVSSLRKTAKSGGRKGQLAHWLANMKAGRAKKNK